MRHYSDTSLGIHPILFEPRDHPESHTSIHSEHRSRWGFVVYLTVEHGDYEVWELLEGVEELVGQFATVEEAISFGRTELT